MFCGIFRYVLATNIKISNDFELLIENGGYWEILAKPCNFHLRKCWGCLLPRDCISHSSRRCGRQKEDAVYSISHPLTHSFIQLQKVLFPILKNVLTTGQTSKQAKKVLFPK